MGESGATDVDTEARTWTVIVTGSAGPLRRALEQAATVSPPERTVVVVTARRPRGLEALRPGRAHVLVEPLDRGSAAAILYPVHWIHARDPEATVVVLGDDPPSIAPGFGHGIVQAARIAERHAESLILLGLPPGVGEPERGFIVPGERIHSTIEGPLFRVRDLVDPDPERDARLGAGALCDGGVFAGRARVFIGAAAEHGAALNDRLARAATFAGRSTSDGRSGRPTRWPRESISSARSSARSPARWQCSRSRTSAGPPTAVRSGCTEAEPRSVSGRGRPRPR